MIFLISPPDQEPIDYCARLIALKSRLAALEAEMGRCVDELETLVDLASERAKQASMSAVAGQTFPVRCGRLAVDRRTFSASYVGKVCFLGDTICFRLIQYLARRPNRYFTYSELLAAVWDGELRTEETIRRAIFDLRGRLRHSGMSHWADAIRSQGGTYGLILDKSIR